MYNVSYKDIGIIDSLPVYDCEKKILNIGCGIGDLDAYLCYLGYQVWATDICQYKEWANEDKKEWQDKNMLRFYDGVSILRMDTVPIKKSPIVICSQVLEHIPEYKVAFRNLMQLCDIRLIVTFPYRKSYNVAKKDLSMVGGSLHCNFWSDEECSEYQNVAEFVQMAQPYPISICKNIGKDGDWQSGNRYYLVVIDKRHKCPRE